MLAATFTVNDPFMASLLTSEDVNVLLTGVERNLPFKPMVGGIKPEALALPENEYQCAHIDINWVQKDGAPKGVMTSDVVRCPNSHEDSWLCEYHERIINGHKKLSGQALAEVTAKLQETFADTQAKGIISHDAKAMAAYPIKRFNRLRVQLCPTPPPLGPYEVKPEWEEI